MFVYLYKCCNTAMIPVMYPARNDYVDDLGLLELSGSHVQQSEVCKTMIDTCGPYNPGGSAIRGKPYRS